MQFNFDATKVQPDEGFSLIPAGTYIAQIEESEIKPTKSGTGQMLKLKWRILDGQYRNRVLFGQINVVNQSQKAEQIGQRQLSALCHSAGVLSLQDTMQLHGKPIKIKVKIRTDESGKYDDQNEISGYESAGSGVVSQPIPAASPQPASASTPPWMSQRRAA